MPPFSTRRAVAHVWSYWVYRLPAYAPDLNPADHLAVTSWDGTIVTGNGTAARYSSPPMT
jgi:hypothetical protein